MPNQMQTNRDKPGNVHYNKYITETACETHCWIDPDRLYHMYVMLVEM